MHCFKTRESFGAHHEKLNEDRPILSATEMYPITLLSGNMRFMRMLAVVLEIYVNFPYIRFTYACAHLRYTVLDLTSIVYNT